MPVTCLLTGNDNLTIQCGMMLRDAGHEIRAVMARDSRVRAWAEAEGIALAEDVAGAVSALPGGVDWLLSIANTDIIPDEVLGLAAKGAVNFHDGPLPAYAGLNAPVWAILNGEPRHGITWHLIEGGVDEGDILAQRMVDISEGETALTLNAKCFAAAIESFDEVIAAIEAGAPERRAQDLSQRSYFGRHDRPAAGGFLDFSRPAAEVARVVNALNHGDYRNPLAAAKIRLGGRVVLVDGAEALPGSAPAGQVSGLGRDSLTVGAEGGVVRLKGLRDVMGAPVSVDAQAGDRVEPVDGAAVEAALKETARRERGWMKRFSDYRPALWGAGAGAPGDWSRELGAADADAARAAYAAVVSALCDHAGVDLALARPERAGLSPWVPVRFEPAGGWDAARGALAQAVAEAGAGFAVDLPARCPDLAERALPMAGLSDGEMVPGTALTLAVAGGHAVLMADTGAISAAEADLIADRVQHLLAALPGVSGDTAVASLPMLPEAEREAVLNTWNATETDFDRDTCIHQFFEAQVAERPDDTALVFEGESLTYAELNARANRLAHVLRGLAVAPGQPVGLHVRRSAELVIGALGILKAGGAYLPLDPAYPADRIALYIEDSETRVIVSESALALETGAEVLEIDTDARLGAAATSNPEPAAGPQDLAYMIYTSGSTGRPKGVMVEHRNVANFFAGMDARIRHDPPGVLLAVTSLSFDISVLELFWTLARGFKVVVSGEEKLVAGGASAVAAPAPGEGMEFSLFYWGNDDGVGRDKYAMLLEGAQFADKNGFVAVWTPERHFHAFGGLYPNPSVTGAAVAAVTRNIGVRAGSCVAPLHHVARIAEEWAIIDNLTNGKAGMAIASGWQPDDFVLRPENAPPNNKPAMMQAIADLRQLWAGEPLMMKKADGSEVARLTQPRPVSKTLPVWVTTAGNPETWRQAGEIGANVLTHLLGQSVEEVGEKIKIYHAALREAGHDPKDFTVTLMLHTYLAADRETARAVAREPMKNYLRSAADLIRQYAWAFPAFKRPEGVDKAHQLDLGSLEPEELEAILDFAFERYFERSGLFGTVDDAMARVSEVKALGVTEVACLIDYGIDRQTVLDGLKPLAQVVARANATAPEGDWSLAAQIERHGVTHFQCTPYMARMLVSNEDSRAALGQVRHMMIGGEALAGSLVAELQAASKASIENMYGPTETTIWSTTETATAEPAVVGIGRPIANTQCYVLGEDMQPCPVGVAGQLWIGGDGVTRGYWKRDELNAEKFRADPFREGNRMFGTGDLARWRADGRLEFLGRNDAQVKIRGFRIELGEIEKVMEQVAGVTQAVVTAEKDATGVGQLVGYVLGRADPAAVRAHLVEELPAHMVPVRFHVLEAFPLTPNKKVDRKALPEAVKAAAKPAPVARAAAPAAPAPAAASDAPKLSTAELTAAVSAVWSEILKVEAIAPSDSFFDLGGHSLLAVEAHRALKARLGLTALSIADIFRSPTLSGLVARIEAISGGGTAKAETALPTAEAASAVADRRRALRQQRGTRV